MMAKKKVREEGGGGVEARTEPEAETAQPKRTPEEIKAQREAMMAKKQARAMGQVEPAAATTEAVAPEAASQVAAAKPKRTPEEIKAQREAMMAKRQGRAAGQAEPAAAKAEPLSTALPPELPAAEPVEIPAKPDDLTKIEGIGPKISGLLQAAGIKTFAALSNTAVDKLQELLTSAGPTFKLADPTTWPEQAKLAAAGEWAELEALQDRLKGGRRQ
ncbi:MAG: helix-hairpin-helix domain-containing protein [Chloroflexota bacterium]